MTIAIRSTLPIDGPDRLLSLVGGRTEPPVEAAIKDADAVLVASEWPEYGVLDWDDLAGRVRGDLVYDTCAILDSARVRRAGLRFASLGRERP